MALTNAQIKAQKALEKAQKNTTIRNVATAAKLQAIADGSTNKEADFKAKSLKREAQRLKDTQRLEVSILKKESGGDAAKTEQAANKTELQEYLGGLLGNNFTTDAQNLTQASTYDAQASRVDDRVLSAYDLAEKYNINPVNYRAQDYTTIRDGIGLGLIDKYLESGGTKPGEGNKNVKIALDRLGGFYSKVDAGQTLTKSELIPTETDASGNTKKIGGVTKVAGTDNVYRVSYGDNEGNDRNVVSEYYAKNADDTYTPLALDKFNYNFNPPPPPEQKKKKWYQDPGKVLTAVAAGALAFVPGAQGLAASLGSTLSGGALTGAAATGLGIGAINAGITGATTGDLDTALKSGFLSGVGSAIASAAGISEASLAAQDASQLASQGLSNSAIQTNLIASGLDPVLAASAADLAVSGATSNAIASNLSGFGDIYGKVATDAVTGLSTSGATGSLLDMTPVDYSLTAGTTKIPGQGLQAEITDLIPAEEIGTTPVDYALTPATSTGGQGLQQPTLPNLSSMGGGQGLSVEVPEGYVTEQGLIPYDSTPILGDQSSFINAADVLGTNVLPAGTATTLSLSDILKTIRTGSSLSNLFGQQTAQPTQQVAQQQLGAYVPDYTGVDYSGLLGLLSQRARRANIASLLG